MSYKTDRLVDLFPDAYGARDAESLLYRLLDAVGADLMRADEALKALLKSHWVDYAEGPALDGLGAIYGVSRRLLRGGGLEPDAAFRQRLKALVPLFTGGGTRQAVVGAVRSALGLPFNLDDLRLPPEYQALRADLDRLVYMEEFSPSGERVVNRTVTEVDGASQLMLTTDIPSVREDRPRIEWTFTVGGGRLLSLELLPAQPGPATAGLRSHEDFVVAPGETLTLSADSQGRLTAAIGLRDVTEHFRNLDGSQPARLPEVPVGRREWRFRAQSAVFDLGRFDSHDAFGLPAFEVQMDWRRYTPLTFDIHVPYFLQQAVADLKAQHRYPGRLFVYEGLPLEAVVDVVDQTRAAGVKGSVQFSLNFFDDHQMQEHVALDGTLATRLDADMRDDLVVTSITDIQESHEATERFVIGGVFDVSPFDGGHGFSE